MHGGEPVVVLNPTGVARFRDAVHGWTAVDRLETRSYEHLKLVLPWHRLWDGKRHSNIRRRTGEAKRLSSEFADFDKLDASCS